MKQKTIRLSSDHRINDDGTVDVYGYLYTDESNDDKWEPVYGWEKTKYKIGAEVILVSHENVSPNSLRSGRDITRWGLVFDAPDGIGGNSNPVITRYHGWRGTNNDISCYAHGLRKIIKIRSMKNGGVAVTVGGDLKPTEE